jgi:predicted Fe-Mo cluster-binding NifX family protein
VRHRKQRCAGSRGDKSGIGYGSITFFTTKEIHPMLIAVPSETDTGLQSPVFPHFGRCPYFTLVKVEAGETRNVSSIENPYHGGHSPGDVPTFVKEQDVTVMLAGGMGRRAVQYFEEYGIEAVTGAQSTVGESVQAYLNGKITGSAPCTDSLTHEDHHHH